ncbi:MAG TPA: hypothetical protein VKC17_08830 [Sphingomicrobium sp.]|nr:hypothetical protein [Sphingomicrobium sp.]
MIEYEQRGALIERRSGSSAKRARESTGGARPRIRSGGASPFDVTNLLRDGCLSFVVQVAKLQLLGSEGIMKIAALCALLCAASTAGAQVRSVSDPSALRMDSHPSKQAAPSQTSATSQAVERLTNESVITLVKAGLGPETVVAKINASSGSYDTSTNALIQLKQAGVPDQVIAAMLTRSKSPVLVNAVADNSSPDPLAMHAPGIYLLDPRGSGRMGRIDATVANQTKTSNLWGYAFSYGLSSLKMKTVIPNVSARAQAANRRPHSIFILTSRARLPRSRSSAPVSPQRQLRPMSLASFGLSRNRTTGKLSSRPSAWAVRNRA